LNKIILNIKRINPKAKILKSILTLEVENPKMIRGKKVLCIEDGPTLTHGGLATGAAFLVAKKFKAKIVDGRKFAVGSIKQTLKKYKHLKKILPAMGYGKKQMKELEETINRAKCDLVLFGTPVDLRRFLKINKPALKVNYELKEVGRIKLGEIISNFLKKKKFI
jgi:predicted GTPase